MTQTENKIVNITPPRLMSLKKAAEYFGVSEYFLRQGVKNGTIPFIRSGTKYYISVDAMMERIESSCKSSF